MGIMVEMVIIVKMAMMVKMIIMVAMDIIVVRIVMVMDEFYGYNLNLYNRPRQGVLEIFTFMSIYLRVEWSWLNKSLSLFYLEQQCPYFLPGVVGHDALKAAVNTRHVDAELLVAHLYSCQLNIVVNI